MMRPTATSATPTLSIEREFGWDGALGAEPAPEALRHAAREHGRALARRHGDDLLGPPLPYTAVAEAIVNRRLQLLSDARGGHLSAIDARIASTAEARKLATKRLEHAVTDSAQHGIETSFVPVLGRRVAGVVAVHLLVIAAISGALAMVVLWLADPWPVAVATGLLGVAVLTRRADGPLKIVETALALARVQRASDALLDASDAESAAEAAHAAVVTRSEALAAAELALAHELVAIHLDAATTAMPAGALVDGGRLDPGHLTLEPPLWMGGCSR